MGRHTCSKWSQAVTNARASGDYHPGNSQWTPLGTTGIFAWAVAIAPTKDNYWSTDKQTGSAYKDFATVAEPYNRLEVGDSSVIHRSVIFHNLPPPSPHRCCRLWFLFRWGVFGE
jgi:hypothetical protein